MNRTKIRQYTGAEPNKLSTPFQRDDYLRAGIREATWQQVTLLQGLLQALENLRESGRRRAYLDGSLATKKELPAGLDVAWEIPALTLGCWTQHR